MDFANVCPECGGGITTSGGRHPARCVRAVCRYEGEGVAPPPVLDPIVAALRAERERQGLSQRQLGRKMQVSSSSLLSEYEAGSVQPGLRILRAWAEALGYQMVLEPVDVPVCTCGAVKYGPLAQHLPGCETRRG